MSIVGFWRGENTEKEFWEGKSSEHTVQTDDGHRHHWHRNMYSRWTTIQRFVANIFTVVNVDIVSGILSLSVKISFYCLINSENKWTVISHLWTALTDKRTVTINLLTFRSSRSSLTSVKSFFQFISVIDLTVHRLSQKELLIIELLSLRNQVGTSLRIRRFYDQGPETYDDNWVWRKITEKKRRFLKRERIE